jgi:hypothetical protein
MGTVYTNIICDIPEKRLHVIKIWGLLMTDNIYLRYIHIGLYYERRG